MLHRAVGAPCVQKQRAKDGLVTPLEDIGDKIVERVKKKGRVNNGVYWIRYYS